jgi:hypothetical protein
MEETELFWGQNHTVGLSRSGTGCPGLYEEMQPATRGFLLMANIHGAQIGGCLLEPDSRTSDVIRRSVASSISHIIIFATNFHIFTQIQGPCARRPC